jgi:hypothetical protein
VGRQSAWMYTSPARLTVFVPCSPLAVSHWQHSTAATIGKLYDSHSVRMRVSLRSAYGEKRAIV